MAYFGAIMAIIAALCFTTISVLNYGAAVKSDQRMELFFECERRNIPDCTWILKE